MQDSRSRNSKHEKLEGFSKFAEVVGSGIINYLKHFIEQSLKLTQHSATTEELSVSSPRISYAKLPFPQF